MFRKTAFGSSGGGGILPLLSLAGRFAGGRYFPIFHLARQLVREGEQLLLAAPGNAESPRFLFRGRPGRRDVNLLRHIRTSSYREIEIRGPDWTCQGAPTTAAGAASAVR